MNRILKINEVAILNFADLQKEFSPWELYKNLPVFLHFANVHCIPLPLRLNHKEADGEVTNYRAEHLDKRFWQNILSQVLAARESKAEVPEVENLKAEPQDAGYTKTENRKLQNQAAKYLENCLGQSYIEKAGIMTESGEILYRRDADEIKAQMVKECLDANVDEKLEYIYECLGFASDESGDVPTNDLPGGELAAALLAICEIAEMNALKLDFRSGAEEFFEREECTAAMFPMVDHVPLTAGTRTYKFWYYEEEGLEEGKKIQTVCVSAKAGTKENNAVIVELYRESNGELVEKVVMEPGTFRYCNVVEGKIIKFLPTESSSATLKMSLKHDKQPKLLVAPSGSEAWSLEAKDISAISAGDKANGFLFIKNGKVNRAFYKAANAYMTEIRMEMILTPLVDVRITENGYELLTEEGLIISDGPRDGMRGFVTLE